MNSKPCDMVSLVLYQNYHRCSWNECKEKFGNTYSLFEMIFQSKILAVDVDCFYKSLHILCVCTFLSKFFGFKLQEHIGILINSSTVVESNSNFASEFV